MTLAACRSALASVRLSALASVRVSALASVARVSALALVVVGGAGCRDWSALGGDFGVPVLTGDLAGAVRQLPDGIEADASVIVGGDPVHDFSPATVSIAAQGSVTWIWRGGTHSLVSDSTPRAWDPTAPQMNGSAGQVFAKPGTYPYHCGQHPSQTGTVIVVP
jgi:plastocyanin